MPWRSRLMASTRSSRSVVERGVLGLDLAQLFLGAQIDRAEPLAVAAQLFEVFLDLGERRQFRARLDLGEAGHGLRLDFQHVVDFALDIGEAALGAIHALFGAGAGLARARQRLQRNLWRRGRFPPSRFRRSASASAATRRALSAMFDFADQRAALFREHRRRIVEFGALGRDLGDAGLDGGDLRGRALPCGSAIRCARPVIACKRRSASSASRASACASARTCAASRRWPSMSVRTAASLVSVSRLGGNSASAAVALSCAASASAAVGGEAAVGFRQRRFARGVAVDLALGRGMAFARGVGLALRGAPGFACGGLGGRCGLQLGLGGFQRLTLGGGIDAGLLELVSRYRPAARARRAAAPRRSARGRRRQIRPSARRRLPATPAAGRSSIAIPVPRRAPWRRRRSARGGAPVRPAPRHGRRAIRRPPAAPDRRRSTPALVQRIGADGSTGASRSSPSAAPIAFS